MMQRLVLVLLGFFGFCLSAAGQQGNVFEETAVSLDQFRHGTAADMTSLPSLTLMGERSFLASSALGRMGMMPPDLFPLAFLQATEARRAALPLPRRSEASPGLAALRLDPDYSSGEVGAYYGRSGGKYGREEFGTYVVGTVGNDKFQITAGASYQESSGHVPRQDVWTRR